MEERLTVVRALGIAESRAQEIAKKDSSYASLVAVLEAAGLAKGTQTSKTVGALLNTLATTFPKAGSKQSMASVASAVVAGEIDSGDRLSAALELVEKAGPGGTVSAEELAKTCCFGLVYKEEEMRSAVLRTLASMSPDTAWESVGKILETTRKSLPFSDGAKVKAAVDSVLTEKFGPPKGKEKKGGDKKNAASSAAAPASDAAAQKSKKKPVHEKLPPIDMNAPSGVIAQQLLSLAADTNKQHALEMIADTIAAIRRNAYAAGLASGNIDPQNGVRLPKRQQ